MECSQARQLIAEGVQPNTTWPGHTELDAHLACCETCRDLLARTRDQALLAQLLSTETSSSRASSHEPVGSDGTSRPAEGSRPARHRPPPPRPLRPYASRLRRPLAWWRYVLFSVLAITALGAGLLVGRIARAAYTIAGNLTAMQVTAGLAIPSTPTLGMPLPTVAASSAPPPTVAPLTPLPATAAPPTPVAPTTAVLASAAWPTDPPDSELAERPATAATVGLTPAPAASTTPISLPPLSNAAPVPTLMATVGIVPVSGEPLNILLLGSDRRPGESWQTRSDAIMVVHLDPARQRVALLSFPRDLIVNIPGYGYSRINAATVYGELYPELGGGVELARQTVANLLDLPIQHVVRTDFGAFTTAVDAIGGIDLTVEQELYDPQYPTMDYGYMVAHFLPGPQHMDGATALIYSRLRHADSDYARARRQQQVIQGLMQRVRDQNILSQVELLANLSSALRDDIQTDLSLDQMIGIAWAFRNVAPEQVERYSLNESLTYVGLEGDPYAITAAPGAIDLVRGQLLGTVAAQP